MLMRLQNTIEDLANMVQTLEQKVIDQYELKKTLIREKVSLRRCSGAYRNSSRR